MKKNWPALASALVAIAGAGIAGLVGTGIIHREHPGSTKPNVNSTVASTLTVNSPEQVSPSSNVENTASPLSDQHPNSNNQAVNSSVANTSEVPSNTSSANSQLSGSIKSVNSSSSSSASGDSHSASTSSAPPASTILGSGNGPFDDSVKAGYDTRVHVLVSFGRAVGIQPDPTGPSPFSDLPTTDANWGMIHAMMEQGICKGIYETKFEPNITFRVRDLAFLYLAYRHIPSRVNQFTPGGGSALAFGQDIGLLTSVTGGYPTAAYQSLGPQDGLCVRFSDTSAFVWNVENVLRGYTVDGQGYDKLFYPVADEQSATFNGVISEVNPPSGPTVAITQTYRVMNDIRVKKSGNNLIFSVPALATSSEWRLFAGNKVDFSLDNGSTWKTVANSGGYSFYDSQSESQGGLPVSRLPSRILLRAPASQGLWIRFYDGGDLMADETITWSANGPVVNRSNAANQQGP